MASLMQDDTFHLLNEQVKAARQRAYNSEGNDDENCGASKEYLEEVLPLTANLYPSP